MSGNATFKGTEYQAGVIAFVFVHVLSETKLRWFPQSDDVPSAVSGEVEGPGDDARLEFARLSPLELQAKHGLRPQKSVEAILSVRDNFSSRSSVILVVDSTSSSAVRNDLRLDLERLRSGRSDGLKAHTLDVLAALGDGAGIVENLHVRTLDVDSESDADAAIALKLLAENIDNPDLASAGWAVLRKEAAVICANRSRRTRQDLIAALAGAGIALLPPARTRRWHQDLEYSKRALGNRNPRGALDILREIEFDLRSGSPDAEILYRLNQHKAEAYLELGKFAEAKRFAQQALDHKPNGAHALVNLANAEQFSNPEEALRISKQAIADHPSEPNAWALHIQLSLLLNQTPEPAPPEIENNREFKRSLCGVYLFRNDAARARDISAALVQDGDRSNFTLLSRCEALLGDIEDTGEPDRTRRAEEINRLTTEVLEKTDERSEGWAVQALVARASANQLLGKTREADEDLEEARRRRPDDLGILAGSVRARMLAGTPEAALELLRTHGLEEAPSLLILRANILAGTGDRPGARRDIDAALALLPQAKQADRLRIGIAEAAVAVGDTDLANKLLQESADAVRVTTPYLAVRARIAWIEGDLQRAEGIFREAAGADAANSDDLLSELGIRSAKSRRFAEAAKALRDVNSRSPVAERAYVHSLVVIGQLGEAQAALNALADRGEIPDWAIGFAAHIALKRNDPDEGLRRLEELVSRGAATPAGRLTLVRGLVDLKRGDQALVHARALLEETDLTPQVQMALAETLNKLGEGDLAIKTGLRAFRRAPQDALIQKAFATVVLRSRTTPERFETVMAETHVILEHEGQTLDYLVFGEPLETKLPNEISLDEARAAGLLGLGIGEAFIEHPGHWFQKEWRVRKIESVVSHIFTEIMTHFGTRFPNEPFFVTNFHLRSDPPSISDLHPIVTSTHQLQRGHAHVFKLYRELGMPLELIAKRTGASIADVMDELARPEGPGPLFAEWSDVDGILASRAGARSAKPLVWTQSALATAQRLEIANTITNRRASIAPRSMRDQVEEELDEAEELLRNGWRAMGTGDRGLTFHEVPAGHPALVAQRDSLARTLEWLDKNITFLSRPLAAFDDPEPQLTDLREQLGEASGDSLELARHTPAVLYADDLGLRRFALTVGTESCSTISMVQALTEAGFLDVLRAPSLLVDLIERHYATVVPTPEILLAATEPGRSLHARRETFGLLSLDIFRIDDAAATVAKAVRGLAIRPLRTMTTSGFVQLALEGMTHRFQPLAAAQAVATAGAAYLELLPQELRAVRSACISFVRTRYGG